MGRYQYHNCLCKIARSDCLRKQLVTAFSKQDDKNGALNENSEPQDDADTDEDLVHQENVHMKRFDLFKTSRLLTGSI